MAPKQKFTTKFFQITQSAWRWRFSPLGKYCVIPKLTQYLLWLLLVYFDQKLLETMSIKIKYASFRYYFPTSGSVTWGHRVFLQFHSLVSFRSHWRPSWPPPFPQASSWTLCFPSPTELLFLTLFRRLPLISFAGISFLRAVSQVLKSAKIQTDWTGLKLRCTLSWESRPPMKRLWFFVNGWFFKTFPNVLTFREWFTCIDRGRLWYRKEWFRINCVFLWVRWFPCPFWRGDSEVSV